MFRFRLFSLLVAVLIGAAVPGALRADLSTQDNVITEEDGPQLLETRSLGTTAPNKAEDESSWLSRFLGGLKKGVLLEDLRGLFAEDFGAGLMELGKMAAVGFIIAALPALVPPLAGVATAAIIASVGWGLIQTGGDAEKLGNFIGQQLTIGLIAGVGARALGAGRAGGLGRSRASRTTGPRPGASRPGNTGLNQGARSSLPRQGTGMNRNHLPVRQNLCFVAGTLIHTALGLVPIEQIHALGPAAAPLAISRHDEARRMAPAGPNPIIEVYHRVSDHLRVLEVEGPRGERESFRTTDNHPFWVAGRGWVEAGDLKAGDALGRLDSGLAVIRVSRREEQPEGVDVYNFQVATDHTYFVGKLGLWVHNQNGCGLTRLTSRELRRLRQNGVNTKELTGLHPHRGRGSLFRDADGRVVVMDRSGTGPATTTGATVRTRGTPGAPGQGARSRIRAQRQQQQANQPASGSTTPVGGKPPKQLQTLARQASRQTGRRGSRMLRDLAESLGFRVTDGGKHLRVERANGSMIQPIPHSLHGSGTARSIARALFREAGFD